MTSPWDDVFNSLVLEPDFREYESAPKHVRERLAAQLAMSLEQYDEKLHWGFSEFYDQEYMTKNWIAKAIKKPNSLRKELHVKKGEKIPAKKLNAAAKKGGKEGQRARLAKTLKGFHNKQVPYEKTTHQLNFIHTLSIRRLSK